MPIKAVELALDILVTLTCSTILGFLGPMDLSCLRASPRFAGKDLPDPYLQSSGSNVEHD